MKVYRGMASLAAYADKPDRQSTHPTAEGVSGWVKSNGSVVNILNELTGGIRSGCSYSGARNLKELREKAIFIKTTPTIIQESGTRL